MKTNIRKTKNQFTASMILECNPEINNEENLKHINTYFIKEFIKKEELLEENKIKANVEKRKPVLIGFAIVSGNDRAKKAIELALSTLLFNEKLMENNTSILLLISSHSIEIDIDEIGLINDYIQEKSSYKADITMMVSEDENLGEALAVTIIISDNLKSQ